MAGLSGSAVSFTFETVESDLTELTDISGSAAHMRPFTAWVPVIYSILVICVLKLHTYLPRCKISTKQNQLPLESVCSVFFHRRLNTAVWIRGACYTVHDTSGGDSHIHQSSSPSKGIMCRNCVSSY